MVCHGCNGKGWVETAGGVMVHICPICRGQGWLSGVVSTGANYLNPSNEPEKNKKEEAIK